MKNTIIITIGILLAVMMQKCTKEIELDYTDIESKLVVDGKIEAGSPPYIFLSNSQNFNHSLDPSSLAEIFVHGATMSINDGTLDYDLYEICASDLSPEQLLVLSQDLGVGIEELESVNYCIYTNLMLIGEIGKTYNLSIEYEEQTLASTTSIKPPVAIDTLWFEPNNNDSLGFLHARITDPSEAGNAYRWFAKRISHKPGTNEPEDMNFISPLGGAFDDTFFNGLEFEFFVARGIETNSNAEEDMNQDAGMFRLGDTIVTNLSSVPQSTYKFFYVLDDQTLNNGSPFAIPTELPSNIEGGLGIWAGYSPFLDTLVVE